LAEGRRKEGVINQALALESITSDLCSYITYSLSRSPALPGGVTGMRDDPSKSAD